jgi:serpin B
MSIAGIFLSSCSGESNPRETFREPIRIELTDAEQQLASEGSTFAATLFSSILEKEKTSENLVISPLSLNMAMAMVWNGANGETKQAIQQAIGMSDYAESEVNAYFKKLREAMVKTDPTTKLAIANSIWTRMGFPVKADFYSVNQHFYNARVNEIDFSSPATVDIINQWCSDNTNGLISKMIDNIPNNLMMYLINAIYFKGKWADEHTFSVSSTLRETFYRENGQITSAMMMKQTNMSGYYQDEYLASTSLPYGNGAFSMVFVLPEPGVALTEVIEKLKDADYWLSCINPGGRYEVNLAIPKFKIEYELKPNWNETLTELGMGIAFSEFADFSGISDVALQISYVRQKACIEVNEEGTEAAAVTVVGMELTAAAPDTPQKVVFRADRPFLFAIRENSTGIVLFMGKVGNPE